MSLGKSAGKAVAGCGCIVVAIVAGAAALLFLTMKGGEKAVEAIDAQIDQMDKAKAERIVQEKAKHEEEEATAIGIDAPTLLQEYEANEVRADQNYKGRFLRVRGIVGSIGKGLTGNQYVTLRGRDENRIFMVQCFFDDSFAGELAGLEAGTLLENVGGTCGGKFGNVLLNDCRFVEPAVAEKPPGGEPAQPVGPQPRQWSDRSGEFSVTATYVRMDGRKVVLRTADGREVSIRLERLNSDDQEYVRGLAD